MNADDLERALNDLFEGQLEGEALAELERELRDHPEARSAYREFQELHHCLRYRSKGTDLTKVVPMERIIQRRQRRAMRQSMMASAALLTLGLLVLMFIMSRSDPPTLSFTTTPGAEISISHDASNQDMPEGRAMDPGSSMELGQGCVELKFRSGVRAVIQGPARLSLEREDLITLHQGIAWFEVPTRAIGFQVATPDLVLTDLGTRFGVISRPRAADQVHVFQGKVRVLNRGLSKAEETLTSGQARNARPDGSWEVIEIDPDPFPTELPKHLNAPVQLIDSETFTSSPKNEIRRGPYVFAAGSELKGFRAEGAKKLVVTLSHESGEISEVTYEGLRLDRAAQARSGNLTTAIYYLDSPPPSGDLQIRTNGTCNGVGGSILALANAHRGKPSVVSTASGPSASLETLASNSMVVASLVANENHSSMPPQSAGSISMLFDGPCGSCFGASAYRLLAKPQSLAVSFQTTGGDPAVAVIAVSPSP